MNSDLKSRLEKILTEKLHCAISIKAFHSVGGGCINKAFRLDSSAGSFFVKWNETDKYPGMFLSETGGLTLLRNTNELSVPEVISFGDVNNTSWLLLEWIERGKIQKTFFADLGRNFAKLHKHSHSSFGLDHDNYIGSLPQSNRSQNNWVDFFIEERLQKQISLAEKNNRIDSRIIAQFDLLFKKLSEIFPDEKPSLLHGDLWNGNCLTGQNGKSVLIDPAVYYGHREIDIAMTKLFGGFDSDFYAAYHEEFPLQKGWQQRSDICNLYPLLVHVNLFGGSYLSQVKEIVSRF